jgi:hypothetical protein
MRALTRFALPLIASFAFLSSSQAGTIIDTGSVAGSYYGGASLDGRQWLGTSFLLDKDYTITGLNGWMSSPRGGDLQVNITSLANGKPGGNLYSSTFTVAAGMNQAWSGVSGLDWSLSAGSYAVTFTPAIGFNASMARNAPVQIGQFFFTDDDGVWRTEPASMGLQVFGVEGAGGTTGDVPEPASIALMGIALAGLAASRRKRA